MNRSDKEPQGHGTPERIAFWVTLLVGAIVILGVIELIRWLVT